MNPLCCDKVFSYRDRAELLLSEIMINSPANIKIHCLPFQAVWHWGTNSSKIDSGTKQPHSRERPHKRIPTRILAGFYSNHGVICPWIIQNSLNQWNGFKSTVAKYHFGYCLSTVLWISTNIYPFSWSKQVLWFYYSMLLCTSLSTWQSHKKWHQRKIFAVFLCCSVTDINIESTFIFFQLSKWCLNTQHLGFN